MSLILASKSPRRKEILQMVTNDFVVRVSDADESYDENMDLSLVPELLAEKKAKGVKIGEGEVVIGCDTVVLNESKLLGKPKTDDEAIKMLKELSNTTHRVISGICVTDGVKTISDSITTYVTLRELSDDEIENYVSKFHPTDKAGAYGIQESAGAFVTKIEGDFYNVVGLPLCRLCEILKNDFNIKIL
ncbi:MAG: septum formation protein Maf [Clostridia bacterium]|nr:septum formation protein Maf [Clostridia bacterium]